MTAVPGAGRPAVVFVGVATLDAIALVDGLPAPDQRVIAHELVFAGGGPAATAAVAAARLGASAAFVGAVGDDQEGQRILGDLQAEGVDVSGAVVVDGRRSGVSVVIVDRRGGTRIICTRPVPPLDVKSSSRSVELIRTADWVHVDHLGWPAVADVLKNAPADVRPKVSVDGGNPIPDFTPQGVDLFVPTVEALARTYGQRSPDRLLDAALADGAETVVATQGGEGSIAATRDGRRHHAPAHRSAILSTLGAGDVFHGALLAAVVAGSPLDNALVTANTVAAMSCAGLDGRSAIPCREELDQVLPSLALALNLSEEHRGFDVQHGYRSRPASTALGGLRHARGGPA